MFRNSQDSWGLLSRILHWLVFILLVMVTFGGLRADDMEKGQAKLDLIMTHKSVGVLILGLMVLRLLWRAANPTPVALSDDKKQVMLGNLVQLLLILLVILQPVLGILMSQSAGHPVAVFALFELPGLVDENKELAAQLKSVHGRLWIIILGLTLVHVAGALKHHLLAKNRTLVRMIRG